MEDEKTQPTGARKKLFWILLMTLLTIGLSLLLYACTGAPGPSGKDAPWPPGVDRELNLSVTVSKPANGTHFVAGEQPVLTITLKDQAGAAFDRANDFSQLRLMLAGPQEPTDTVTAVKLLKTSADRSQPVHHYVDLTTNADVQINGDTLTYKLAAISDEKPGTYSASVWGVSKADSFQQFMKVAEFQIGTATVEKQIVEKEKCASCHLGADSGKYYFHHIDQIGFFPAGNFAIDQNAVSNCKACHNNDGYAATLAEDGKTRNVPSPIVKKVHGVHMGEELKNPLNTDPEKGIFKYYTGVLFPNNVKNCNSCHVDDRWKTKPSQLACGSCHDNVWFGEAASMPKTAVAHQGGPQPNDAACATCHTPDTGGVKSVAEAHKVEQSMNKIDVSLTPPRNGKFYVAGERPVVTLVIKNDKGNPIDHTTVSETTFSTASLFVYGPRLNPVPVLANAAKNGNSKLRASITSTKPASGTPKGWTFDTGDTFKIAIHGGPVQELVAPVGLQTPEQVVTWLQSGLKDVKVTANTAGNINILSSIPGDKSRFEIYNSAVTTKMGWKPGGLDIIEKGVVVGKTVGTTVEPFVVIGQASTAGNDLRPRTDPLNYTDPNVTRNSDNITYQLDDVASLKPGTYMIYTYVLPAAGKVPDYALKTGIGFLTFQVGTETPDKKVATNCTNCHGSNIWHLDEGPIHAEPFDTDYCTACHDYGRSGTGEGFSRTGGTSTSGWAGYGAKPLSARLHGVHRGAYLDHPENVYAGNPNAFSEVIFPQDIRNCTKCHSAETTGTWKTESSRQSCMSCHDTNSAKAHGMLMTSDPTPVDPYGPDGVETCKTCHGDGKEFAPDKVHNISDPYKPPYPREPEE